MGKPRIKESKLHVDMDAFFVEVERLDDPSLRGLPVVVGGKGRRGVVASASYEARKWGVHSALPMVAAWRKCPDMVVVSPRHHRYAEVSKQVFAIFEDFTPLVQGLSLDEAFLDVSGLRYHYPNARAVADAIRDRILKEMGLVASVGAANTLFLAKIASEKAKPDGVFIIKSGTEQEFLRGLSVGQLWGVGKATQSTLAEMGISMVGELADTSLGVLQDRLGSAAGEHLYRLSHGIDKREVTPGHDPKSLSAEQTYSVNISGREGLETELLRLADRVGFRMRRENLSGRTVTLKVRFPDFTTITRSETLSGEINLTHDLYQVACRLLDKANPRAKPVRLLGVGVSNLTMGKSTCMQSLEGEEKWEKLTEAVDGARRRFGHHALVPARLIGVPTPPPTGNETNSS